METEVVDEGWIEELGGEAAVVLAGVGACTAAGEGFLLGPGTMASNSHSVRFGKRFTQLPQTGRCSSHLTFLSLHERHPKRDFVWLRFVAISLGGPGRRIPNKKSVFAPSIGVLLGILLL